MKTTGEEHGLTVLPSGGLGWCTVGAVDGREYAVVRVQDGARDELCVVHPKWMDMATARAVGAALFEMTED